jgi:hypothetical protein
MHFVACACVPVNADSSFKIQSSTVRGIFFELSAEKCVKPSSRETSSLLEARIVKRRLNVVHSPSCGVGLLENFSIEV